MPILQLRQTSVAFGGPTILDQVDLQIDGNERLCLLGRNGAGKSTLMKLLAGTIEPDEGERLCAETTRVSVLQQDIPEIQGKVFDVVAAGLPKLGRLLSHYHNLSHQLASHEGDHSVILKDIDDVQHELEAQGGWSYTNKIDTLLSRLNLPADDKFQQLSGGQKRRVLLAQALVCEPDLLMLDEPTNHLDIAAIDWLEEFLLNYPGSILFVTHDRELLKKISTRIIELDRGKINSFPGDFDNYLRRKEEIEQAQIKQQQRFDKKLTQEETWIRQGIKARRTRNEGRVKALLKMRQERAQRQNKLGKVKFQDQDGELSGRLVIDAKDLSFSFGDRVIFSNFTSLIMRGDRVGIVGPNGCGKSTLLRVLLGELPKQTGKLRIGTKLDIAYFDQHRAQLDTKRSIRDNVSDGSDYVTVNGKQRHVIAYLKDFLFPPQQVDTPVEALSGGERNRVLLAKIFTRPSNLLILDEPTNDLDVETLELLEDLIMQYTGTVLLVSHDRRFIDNVVTSTVYLDGRGSIEEFVGGYEDFVRQSKLAGWAKHEVEKVPQKKLAKTQNKTRQKKLSFNETRELKELPKKIENLEAEQDQLHAKLIDPEYCKTAGKEIAQLQTRLKELETELVQSYDRWESLEAIANGNQ